MVFLLAETPQGYGLFNMSNDSLVEATPEEAKKQMESSEGVKSTLTLEAFKRFKDMKQATEEAVKLQEGKMGSVLKKFLKKTIKPKKGNAALAVWDRNLGKSIVKKFDKLKIVMNPTVHEIFRQLRTHLDELVETDATGTQTMAMSLSHSLSRYKLKFSPEKVDVMIIQAVGLLEDLDKEANNLAMRLKEWYGFHFPELLKIVDSNIAFARMVLKIGYRTNCKNVKDFNSPIEGVESAGDLAGGISAEVEEQIRNAAETSMGSELVDTDLECINDIAKRILALNKYREELTSYLRKRMEAIAPNLTLLVGETLGAKLLAQAGSLTDLAKQPASTVQILGAEKALFRALKTRSNTPKYGLIFHAKCVGQAPPKLKGKMSRVIANKIALCVRADAYSENANSDQPATPEVGMAAKVFCERRLEQLGEEMLSSSNFKSSIPTPRYTPSRLAQ